MSDTAHIFISHASADDDFVKELRIKLELHDLKVWVDSRNLRGGDQLKPEIEHAIKCARQVIVVLSPKTINSTWVHEEIQLAEQLAKDNEDYRVIPLMLPGIEHAALNMWFKEEPIGVKIQLEVGQLQEKISEILAALGERLPDDNEQPKEITAKPVAELLLELSRPKLTQQEDGSFQLSSEAELDYIPADPNQPRVKSRRFNFISPVGQIEQDELSWYLEKYYLWTTGLFQKRAKEIEIKLPQWGKAIFTAVLEKEVCRDAVTGWHDAGTEFERRFSVHVDANLLEDSSDEEQNNAFEAASKIFSLPWELLHNGKRYLSEGANPVRVRRRLPNYENREPMVTRLPIRILLLSPRPEDEHTSYIDHRVSAKPLVDAVESLGDLVQLTVLTPPTLAALENELKRAKAANQPYHVLHFDGLGVYDPKHGLGALCFEDPKDSHKLEQRAMQLVYAKYQEGNSESEKNIASLVHDYRIPLVFLEACQTAQSEANPNASVAASLLEEGVASVIAMSHSVLVETARRFVTSFYTSLAQGQRVGQAMLDGQKTLMQDSYRLPILGEGALHLQDWFVPILYQEKYDPQLFESIPSDRATMLSNQQRQARLGSLLDTPTHTFIGRSRELLKLERLLEHQPYAVIRGQGGIGKTTLAVELSRWLVRSARFERCAFVSLERYSQDRAVLDELGRQLVGSHYSVAVYGDDLEKAMQPIQRVLENESCLLLLDNLESLLADGENIEKVLSLFNQLLPVDWGEAPNPTLVVHVGVASITPIDNKTRLLFTTRENLPAPFNNQQRQVTLGELKKDDAKKLIIRVMAEQGLQLKHDDQGRTPEEVDALSDAVNGHARALVLLARELSIQGMTATTQNIQSIMQQLEQQHPGKRELSLFASVELSLQRLSAESRELIKGLAVFYDGGNVSVIAHVLNIDTETAKQLCVELIQVGLAEGKAYTYLRLDPALPNYLSLQLQDEQKLLYRQHWSETMSQLVNYLLQQQSKNAILSAQLTQLELPNLMAFIRRLNRQMQAEQAEAGSVSDKAGSIEQLLANLNYPQELAEVVRIRLQAAVQLGRWNHARFETERLTIDRLSDLGNFQQALAAVRKLLKHCEQAGAEAYPGAGYDMAMVNCQLGRVLIHNNDYAKALPYLRQAQQVFETLGNRGSSMISTSLTDQGICLTKLGKLKLAAATYQQAIKHDQKRGATRDVAVGKGQLATVRSLQNENTAALQGYHEAMELFLQLDEPDAIATGYHQIGLVYKKQAQFSQAESAFRQSLIIETRQGNRLGEATSLGELGNLYYDWNHPEKAVDFFQQAAEICTKQGDKRFEGLWRSNLASTLLKLNRLDYARMELQRAINCKKSLGHAAEPWLTWNILHNLEHADGHTQAAHEARQKAILAYYSYRQDGGENHSNEGNLAVDVLMAMQQNDTAEIDQVIEQLLEQEDWQKNKTFLNNLQSILAGDRNPGLAEDDELQYDMIAELKLLLEQL